MGDDEAMAREEAYLKDQFGGGLLGASDEQIHDFVESQHATTGPGWDGGQSRTDAPTSFPGDTASTQQEGAAEHEDALDELGHHVAMDELAHHATKAIGFESTGAAGVTGMFLGMERDTPQSPETVRLETEAREAEAKQQAELERFRQEHPEANETPDASVPDATTQ